MAKKNLLLEATPYPVERATTRLGANLRSARLRRNLTIEEVAAKIGTGRRAVMDAEKGKPSTSTAVYVALLWTYDMIEQLESLADPATDLECPHIALSQQRQRARHSAGLSNDF